MSQGRAWWRQDRRWLSRLSPAPAAALFGAGALLLGHGLVATLTAEAGFGVAAGFTVAAGIGLGSAWRGRADDDPGHVSDGVTFRLVPTGTMRGAPIATLTGVDDSPVAALHLETLHPAGSPVYGIDTVTAELGGRVLQLEHRRPPAPTNRADLAVDLELRRVDQAGTNVAAAHRIPADDGGRWSVTGRHVTLSWCVPGGRSRRPARRFLVDADRSERVFLLEHTHRHRLPQVHFSAPTELDPAEVLLCMWLAHLLDAHARGREGWVLPEPDGHWSLVPDDFPSYSVGPGGFGRISNMPGGSVGGGYGGST